MRTLIFCLLALIQFFISSQAGAEDYPGYVRDVKAERNERFYEIYLFMNPAPAEKKLQEEIFNRELSMEFRQKYHDRFGQIDTESIAYQKYNFGPLEDYRAGENAFVKTTEERRAFAEYMTRRLAEWHIDNYLKNDPTMHPVYEVKDRISNVQVEVTPDSKLDLEYSLAGNTLDIIYRNPYLDSRIILEMDSKAFGPAPVQEKRLQLGKNINTNLRVNTYAAEEDGIGTLEFIRTFKNWSASISGSSYFREKGKSTRETRTALAISHSY